MLQFYVIIFSIFYEKKDASAKFQYFNPNWHELKKQGKCSSLAPPGIKFYKIQYAWQGVKLTKMMSIFTSKKVWKYLKNIQLTKSDPKRTKGQCQIGLKFKMAKYIFQDKCKK